MAAPSPSNDDRSRGATCPLNLGSTHTPTIPFSVNGISFQHPAHWITLLQPGTLVSPWWIIELHTFVSNDPVPLIIRLTLSPDRAEGSQGAESPAATIDQAVQEVSDAMKNVFTNLSLTSCTGTLGGQPAAGFDYQFESASRQKAPLTGASNLIWRALARSGFRSKTALTGQLLCAKIANRIVLLNWYAAAPVFPQVRPAVDLVCNSLAISPRREGANEPVTSSANGVEFQHPEGEVTVAPVEGGCCNIIAPRGMSVAVWPGGTPTTTALAFHKQTMKIGKHKKVSYTPASRTVAGQAGECHDVTFKSQGHACFGQADAAVLGNRTVLVYWSQVNESAGEYFPVADLIRRTLKTA